MTVFIIIQIYFMRNITSYLSGEKDKLFHFYAFLKKEGHIALHLSVGKNCAMSVYLNFVQLVTQEDFDQEASNLIVLDE